MVSHVSGSNEAFLLFRRTWASNCMQHFNGPEWNGKILLAPYPIKCRHLSPVPPTNFHVNDTKIEPTLSPALQVGQVLLLLVSLCLTCKKEQRNCHSDLTCFHPTEWEIASFFWAPRKGAANHFLCCPQQFDKGCILGASEIVQEK